MKSKLYFQINETNKMSSKIKENFADKPKKVYIFSSTFKEGGFAILEDEFIDTNAKIYAVIGIDKKNTTKLMLDSILKYTDDVYVYSNNNLIEFDGSICIFEYKDYALMYNLSSNISESGLNTNTSLYFETEYNLLDADDKKEYKNVIKTVISMVEDAANNFTKLTLELIDQLQDNKEIFTTKQYTHNVMSIAELLGKEPAAKKDKEEVNSDIDDVFSNVDIPKIDLDDDLEIDDIDFSQVDSEPVRVEEEKIETSSDDKLDDFSELDIDEERKIDEKVEEILKMNDFFDDETEEEENSLDADFDLEGTLDIADMLFSKADLKLDVEGEEDSSKEEEPEAFVDDELVKVKKVNLNNISNFIFELPAKSKTSKTQDVLKIPNYISKMIPNFLEIADKAKTVERNEGVYKIRNITLELVDVKNGSKYTDREATISFKVGQSFVSIVSDIFKNVDYNEMDIARIIKLDSKVYHVEIIPTDMQEYKLWDKLCTQEFKASSRKYGMM